MMKLGYCLISFQTNDDFDDVSFQVAEDFKIQFKLSLQTESNWRDFSCFQINGIYPSTGIRSDILLSNLGVLSCLNIDTATCFVVITIQQIKELNTFILKAEFTMNTAVRTGHLSKNQMKLYRSAVASLIAWVAVSETNEYIHLSPIENADLCQGHRKTPVARTITSLYEHAHELQRQNERKLKKDFNSSVSANMNTGTEFIEQRNLRLPLDIFSNIITYLDAPNLLSISCTCRQMFDLALGVVPGLRLQLFPHQQQSVRWMVSRERNMVRFPHPAWRILQNGVCGNVLTGELKMGPPPTIQGICGGLLCDEPGLGKTITLLALILRRLGTTATKNDVDVEDTVISRQRLRHSHNRVRQADINRAIPSGATLVVVSEVLRSQWREQIDRHAHPHVLKGASVFIDEDETIPLPPPEILAKCAIIVTTHKRLVMEWRNGRPVCLSDIRSPTYLNDHYIVPSGNITMPKAIRGSIEDAITTTLSEQKVSPLLGLIFYRIAFDEGHTLGRSGISESLLMASCLLTRCRWIISGTPTPSDTAKALAYLKQQFTFLRHPILINHSEESLWRKLISPTFDPNFAGDETFGIPALVQLLSQNMVRHSKIDIADIPRPVHSVVPLQLSAIEAKVYNFFVSIAQANLVITDLDPRRPGSLHPDSLLNSTNRDALGELITNLRIATCGAGRSRLTLAHADRVFPQVEERVRMECGEEGAQRVRRYLIDALDGERTPCDHCRVRLEMLIITPCGHYFCASCVRQAFNECSICHRIFDWEALQTLQPGFGCANFIFDKGTPSIFATETSILSHQSSPSFIQPSPISPTATTFGEIPSAKINYVLDKIFKLEMEWKEREKHIIPDRIIDELMDESTVKRPRVLFSANPDITGMNSKRGIEDETTTEEDGQDTPLSSSSSDSVNDRMVSFSPRMRNLLQMNDLIDKRNFQASRSKRSRSPFSFNLKLNNKSQIQTNLESKPIPKVVVFSEFPYFLMRLAIEFRLRGISFSQLGGTGGRAASKTRELTRFRVIPSVRVLLLSSEGSHGLDLSFVTHMFLMDAVLDASLEQQVISRAYRMGAKQAVQVEQLFTQNTLEESLFGMRSERENNIEINLTSQDDTRVRSNHHVSATTSKLRRLIQSVTLIPTGLDYA